MIYELRIYDAAPGKLPALKDRFANHTVDLFTKHDISTVGFWISYVGPCTSSLSYILAWVDPSERQRCCEAFTNEPGVDSRQIAVGGRRTTGRARSEHHTRSDRALAPPLSCTGPLRKN